MSDQDKRTADKEQLSRFKEVAREIGCDDNEQAFEQRLKGIAKAISPSQEKKPVRKKASS